MGIGVDGWFTPPETGWYISKKGYRYSGEGSTRVYEHVLVAEKALGKPLPTDAVVHHVNEIPSDNTPTNLVVCSRPYHNLLHARMRAMDACGNPNWRLCARCGNHGDPETMSAYRNPKWPETYATVYAHRECNNRHMRQCNARKARAK